ncbi:MAG: iron ABC transporter permease [Spirochaetaceae bacterium]|nr:MAG: iron ABC transporter permease [Spirochaetaceae bacterium]
MGVPLSYLVLRAAEADPAILRDLIWRRRTLDLFVNTILLTGGVLTVTTLIGVPLAWIVTRTDLKGMRWITLASVMPLAIPGYVMAHALLSLGGRNGIAALAGLQIARPTGLVGAIAALSLYSFPYMFLNVRSAFRSLDPGVEESARSLGYSPVQVYMKVVIPMLLPGLLAGWVIIALYTLGDFGAVALMRYEVFSFAIYTQYAGAFDRTYASVLALILLVMTAGPVILEARLLRSVRYSRLGSGVGRKHRLVHVGRLGRLASWAFIVLVLCASIGMPVFSLLWWMLQRPPWGEMGRIFELFLNSTAAAVPAAVLAVLLALPLAYARVRYPSRTTMIAERTAYIGYAVPPLALALAFVFFSLRGVPFLYQRLPLLIFAYAMNFLALAIGPIRSTLMLAPRKLDETARSLGYSPQAAFLYAVLPLLRSGVFASFTLVFVMAMKELPLAFLLAPTGFTTLSVAVFSRTSEAQLVDAAPYAAAIVLFSSFFVGLMLKYEGRH